MKGAKKGKGIIMYWVFTLGRYSARLTYITVLNKIFSAQFVQEICKRKLEGKLETRITKYTLKGSWRVMHSCNSVLGDVVSWLGKTHQNVASEHHGKLVLGPALDNIPGKAQSLKEGCGLQWSRSVHYTVC